MKTIFSSVLLGLLIFSSTIAQTTIVKDDAHGIIMKSLKLISNKQASSKTYTDLAEAYFVLGEMENANNWYKHALIFNEFKASRHYQNYANALTASNQKEKANEMYAKATAFSPENVSGNSLNSPKIHTVNNTYNVTPVSINSEQMDFAPSFYADHSLVFSSARIDVGKTKNEVDRWTGVPFNNLYKASVTENGAVNEDITLFSIEGSKGLHGSTTAFTKDGSTVYFTKEIFVNRKRGGNKSVFKIFQARLDNGKWKNVVELPFNTDHYSSAHPALSPDGSTLYFVSDRVGSYGVSDIWKVKVFDDGMGFGLPEKLGPNINTKGKDSFPFVSASGKLYFSSDGHEGHGGMDVYVADIVNTPIDQVVVKNLGAPINSQSDDITFIINDKNKKGYFSSNREHGVGRDDIYSFVVRKSEVASE